MNLSKEALVELAEEYGKTFYLLDVDQFSNNIDEMTSAFQKYYDNFFISYSYKTNYIPLLCKKINEKGGYAEIVSQMEYEIAKRCGVVDSNIVYNGPYKDSETMKLLFQNGGIVNLDSEEDYNAAKNLAAKNQERYGVGLRVNFDLGDNVVSRFGFDVGSESFERVLNDLNKSDVPLYLQGIHLHFASRSLKYWPKRIKELIKVLNRIEGEVEYISLGGGIFGKMADTLKTQFSDSVPDYDEYADAILPELCDYFHGKKRPKLFIEPGTALVGDCMKFVCPVVSIKNVRGKDIATLLGSVYNINPTLNGKNPPICVYSMSEQENDVNEYQDLDFGGYTCIESDYLYKHYKGKVCVGDYIVFDNVGSYSVVLKPPFILPNFPVIAMCNDVAEEIKRKETMDDLFITYKF